MRRTLFNLSHERLLTCNLGQLVPICVAELSPGDIWRQHTSALIRLQALLAPVYHKVDVIIEHFFVPYRILWNESQNESWEAFITTGLNGQQTPEFPTITLPNSGAGGVVENSLADYLRIPLGNNADGSGYEVSAFKFRAYAEICNNWYFDQQLDTLLTVDLGSGPDTTTNTTLQYARWGKDYFTAARPEPQLGSEVTIPLTGNAPITGLYNASATQTSAATFYEVNDNANSFTRANTDGERTFDIVTRDVSSGTPTLSAPVEADLSSVSAVDINELRTASAIQRFKEKLNRYGARYTEFLQSFFHVHPQDARLQIPEYLGGGKSVIQFSEVLQTAEGTDPVGELRGHGIATNRTRRINFHAKEHGIVMTLMHLRPKTVYSQGFDRMDIRRSPYDYLLPDFANLGDQAVSYKEVYAPHTTPDGVFGYTPRFDEYRYIPNSMSGEFHSSLDYWHLARIFESDPALNSAFVNMATASGGVSDRIFATSAAQAQIRAIHNIKAKRPIPKFANPSLR